MLDNEFHIYREAKATLVSIVSPKFEFHKDIKETERSMSELHELLRTLEIETGSEHIQNRKTVDPATIIGSGKLKEISEVAKAEKSTLLVFDCELTSSQIRNIKKISGLSVIDRCHVILEIFAKHARTKEAKLQIEISRLQYILPRLSGFWTHLGRQRGGVGVMGGEGEQQIELDRRIIRERIERFKTELKNLVKSRQEQSKKRKNKAVTAALVGYTNAGKSSIMNRLCRVNILEENKLFATLDSTYRMLNPDTKPPMILIDTVGFISNLPAMLVEGFKTTLESAIEADLLIIVCDISDPHMDKHLEVTHKVLNDLGIDEKDHIIVFNKKDLACDELRKKIILRTHPRSFLVSSFDEEDIEGLRKYVIEYFLEQQEKYDLFVPYEKGEIHSKVSSNTNIITRSTHEKGIYYKIRVPGFIFKNLGLNDYILSPKSELYQKLKDSVLKE
ncbi:MAG: GTPase HflX [Epsilonproteobacteria bacterium]|nr:MAG: GTPase HflX [Campylobacterota bacterium]RLA66716.1 MAG: GTPase HflX [Campylobacterota bacterium]